MAKGNENWDYLPGGKVRDKKTGAVGVIRMVGGRRIFIKDGQSLSDAMIQSGKFKGQKTKPGMRESYREEKDKDKEEVKKLRDEYEKDTKNDEKLKAYLDKQDEYLDKYEEYKDKTELKRETEPLREDYRNKQFEERQKEAVDKLNKNAEDGVLNDIKDFLSGREDYDGSREDFINDLSKEWNVDRDKVEDMLHEESAKSPRNFNNPSKATQKQVEDMMNDEDYQKKLNKEVNELVGNATPREKSNFERAKEEKEKLEQEMKDLENSWLTHYNESNFNDEEWRKKSDELMNARNEKREAFDKAFKDYINLADDKDLSWQDKVRRNDIAQEEELAKLKEKQHSPEYMFHQDKWRDDYYGTFEKYEQENAKLKEANAKPEDLYEPISSYYSFNKKRHELSGDKMNDDGSVAEWGDKKFTGKDYTNDEFMEHLEDANWHTERRMLETAGLTNQELSYIKDKVTLDSYGADLDRDKTQKLIDEAKAKFRGNDKSNEKINSREFKASMGEVDIPDDFVAQFNDYAKRQEEKKSTNQTMNDAIREKASKSKIDYDNIDNYEVYEQGMKVASENKYSPLATEIHEKLDKIDRANKRGSGYDTKPTNELREILKRSQSTNDAIVHPHPSEATSIKVKGDSNVIPRNFTEGTINFKREGDTKTEQYTIKKDEFGRYIGTDASGQTYQFPIGILRNHNVVEFTNSSDTPKTSSNDYMNSKIRKGAGVKDAYKEYLKEHKDSNITFEQFKKIYNK